jgi:hypothetical protein
MNTTRCLAALAAALLICAGGAAVAASFEWTPPQRSQDAEPRANRDQIIPVLTVTATPKPTANVSAYNRTYLIDLTKFGIHNDGTHATETSKGINAALQDAKRVEANRIVFPPGVYLISETAPVVLDLHDTIVDLNGATLQIQSNGLPKYAVVEIVNGADNLRLTNGTLRGDRDTHDYKAQPGTHEWGAGLHVISGINLEIDHLTLTECAGDGVSTTISGNRTRPELLAMIFRSVMHKDLEPGGFSEKGDKVVSRDQTRSKEPWDLSRCGGEFEFGYMGGLMGFPFIQGRVFQVYFLDAEGRFLEKQRCLQYRKVILPAGAKSAWFEFNQPVISEEPAHAGAPKGSWLARITNFKPPRDVHFHHNVLTRNRRLGMAYTGGQRWIIEENRFEANGGTAPSYGVDFEDGSELLQDVVFRKNTFAGNKAGDLVVCAGTELSFEENVFEKSVTLWGRPHNYTFCRNHFIGGTVIYCTRTGIAAIHDNWYQNCKLSIVFDTKAVADGLVREPGKTVPTPPLLLDGEHLDRMQEVGGTYLNFKNSHFRDTTLLAGPNTQLVQFEGCDFANSTLSFEEKGPVVSYSLKENKGELPLTGPGQARKVLAAP